jgi:hypothetical protein
MSSVGPDHRTYRALNLDLLFTFVALLAITAFAPLVLQGALHQHTWLAVVWLGILAWFWFNALFRIAYRIDVERDCVEFKTLARRYRVPMTRIRSIRSRSKISTVKWEGGRIDLWGSFDGWLDFVNQVKAANPAVELKGI